MRLCDVCRAELPIDYETTRTHFVVTDIIDPWKVHVAGHHVTLTPEVESGGHDVCAACMNEVIDAIHRKTTRALG